MHRYAPYHHPPPSPLSSSPHRMRLRTQMRYHSPMYTHESFEIVVPTSPLTPPPPASPTRPSCEEVPPAQAARALSNLHTALSKAEAGFSRVSKMREQQAGFAAAQECSLAELQLEAVALEEELKEKEQELVYVEKEIVKMLNKNPIRTRSSRRNREDLAENLQYALRSMRVKST